MNRKGLVVGGVILLIIAAAAVFFVNRPDTSSMNTSDKTSMADMNMPAKSDTDTKSTAKPAATNKVEISNYAFTPATITVKAGTTVTWTNQDAIAHTVTANDSSADAPASGNIPQGQSYSFTFKKAGTYHYHCIPHPYMKGTVIVTE